MATAKKGLSVKTFQGLSKKRMEKKTNANFGKRMIIKDGDTIPVQFLSKPDDFIEFEQHQFQEDGRWQFVPCLGDECPLCDSDTEQMKKTSYRFMCNVYNLKEKKVQILEGPKDMAGRIFYRYERKPAMFLKGTFEITRFPTKPTTYACDKGDDDPVKVNGLTLHNLNEYIDEEAKRYYGDDLPATSALDADDEIEEDDDLDEEDEDEEDDDLDDDDSDDEDDDEDDDDDDEDDEDDDDEDEDEEEDDEDEDDEPAPPPVKTSAAKKAAAKKAPAKAAAKRSRR